MSFQYHLLVTSELSLVIPARDTGIQSISSWTLFLRYAPRIRCQLHNLQILLYLDSSVKHWNDTLLVLR
ncbi:hypothetical protein [Wolbachia endosymbiont (group A) of Anomoia purmunda]|uniref:hypothetical protein n=1 Tax=Wolbachia endosymbiont (group A) of Anomoia purmunda TaxID=2953978 RepID=UPI00222F4C56|nr:hypothetical protein [Wolbachia endosymbiont (group A) of Anomoia purmunda]